MPSEWHVIRVHSRAEYLAAEELTKDGHEIFFPCVKVAYPRAGHTDMPLFPGYMFIRFDAQKDGWPLFRAAHRVAGWVKFQGEIPTVPSEIVDALALRLDERTGGQGLWRRFKPGDMVQVLSGSLEGLGQVVEEAKLPTGRAKILITFMGRIVQAKVPWDALQFAEEQQQNGTQPKPKLPRRTRGKGRWTRAHKPLPAVTV